MGLNRYGAGRGGALAHAGGGILSPPTKRIDCRFGRMAETRVEAVSSTWLQAYIAEFNYRFNRRATTHSGGLWRFMLRRLMRGAWSPWTDRTAAFEARRAA